MIKYKILSVVLLLFLVSCTSQKKKAGEDTGDADAIKKFELVEVWKTDTLFRVPESVIYDKDNDVVYVSNMNDNPREKDGNGFISRLKGRIPDPASEPALRKALTSASDRERRAAGEAYLRLFSRQY